MEIGVGVMLGADWPRTLHGAQARAGLSAPSPAVFRGKLFKIIQAITNPVNPSADVDLQLMG